MPVTKGSVSIQRRLYGRQKRRRRRTMSTGFDNKPYKDR